MRPGLALEQDEVQARTILWHVMIIRQATAGGEPRAGSRIWRNEEYRGTVPLDESYGRRRNKRLT